MTEASREGGIEAPTRHPIDWKSAEFWDQQSLFKEMERAYDICHGCRRCVSLCQAFPTLFDLVDESSTMEVDGVATEDYWKVVDQCYLCDLCYQVKCPYVPPHPWNLDFPHLMLRAKAQKFRSHGASPSHKILTSTTAVGKAATLPLVVKMVNSANRSPGARKVLEKTLDVHRDAAIPPYARPRLSQRVEAGAGLDCEVKAAGPTRGRVAVFGTCYGEFNRPNIGEDLFAVFAHSGVPVKLIGGVGCCGMPKLELGDLEAVERYKTQNIPTMLAMVEDGWDIVSPIPSCTLMFKQELPLLFPDDAAVQTVREHTFDPFEYLMHRHREGLFNTEFRQGLGTVVYHVPCHQRVQNIGPKTREILDLVPDTRIEVIERCSGHDGTYGVRKQTFEAAVKIARPVVRKAKQAEPDHVSSDCPMAADHIERGLASGKDPQHPLSLLRHAYGI